MLCTSNASDLSVATRHASGSVSWRVIAKRVLCYVDTTTAATSETDTDSTASAYSTYNEYFWLNISSVFFLFDKYLQLVGVKLWWKTGKNDEVSYSMPACVLVYCLLYTEKK